MSKYTGVTADGGVVTVFNEHVLLSRRNHVDYNTTVTVRPTGGISQLTFLFPPGDCVYTSVIMPMQDKEASIEAVEDAAGIQTHVAFMPVGASSDPFDVNVEVEVEHPARLTSHYRDSGGEGLQDIRIVVAYDGDAPPAHIWHSELDQYGNIIGETEAVPTPTDPDDDLFSLQKVELRLQNVEPGRILGFRWEW